jgi:hypothetical protein
MPNKINYLQLPNTWTYEPRHICMHHTNQLKKEHPTHPRLSSMTIPKLPITFHLRHICLHYTTQLKKKHPTHPRLSSTTIPKLPITIHLKNTKNIGSNSWLFHNTHTNIHTYPKTNGSMHMNKISHMIQSISDCAIHSRSSFQVVSGIRNVKVILKWVNPCGKHSINHQQESFSLFPNWY